MMQDGIRMEDVYGMILADPSRQQEERTTTVNLSPFFFACRIYAPLTQTTTAMTNQDAKPPTAQLQFATYTGQILPILVKENRQLREFTILLVHCLRHFGFILATHLRVKPI